MTDIKPQSIRFSGYRLTPDKQARIFLPGFGKLGNRVQAEAVLPGSEQTTPVPLERQGDYWFSKSALPLGTAYRFKVNGEIRHDYIEKVNRLGQDFNLISPHEATAPRRSTVMADIYLDSLVPREELRRLAIENGGLLPMRNHFNLYGGNEAGLLQLMPHLQEAGIQALLFKPFIGGDNLSSHRYWTIDPYVLNNSFSSKTAFRHFLNTMLSSGMKLYADGAFVNQGLNGVQFMSNLAHGFRSPYWDWFTYEEGKVPGGALEFPKHTYEKFTFGILPTVLDKKTGHREIAFDRFAFRIINEPDRAGYDARKPTFVELYDPNTQSADGKPRKPEHIISGSEDSVVNYRFPVSADEVREKQKELTRPDKHLSEKEKKQLLMEWKAFRLSAATLDDSSFKWDGQIDVAKMNMKNPDVVDYLDGAVGYWTRMVNNTYVDTVARAMVKARAKNPQASPLELVDAVTRGASKGDSDLQVLPPVNLPDEEKIDKREIEHLLDRLQACDAKDVAASVAKTMVHEVPPAVLDLPALFKADLSYPGFNRALKDQPAGLWAKSIHMLLNPLAKIPLIGPLFAAVRDLLVPPAFERALGKKMDKVINLLTPEAQDKLRYGKMQSLVADTLAENIYMQIFTGLDPAKATPQQLEEGLYNTVPDAILKADPATAAKLLPGFMKQRLKQLDTGALVRSLEKQLDGLDPQLAAVAEAMLQKREYGLNWRIDAAKDVGDMDRIRTADKKDRAGLFREEMAFVKRFWEKLGGTIKGIFPQSAIIAELTDFELMSGDDGKIANELMGELFNSNVFTSTPNMRYVYSQLHQLINYAQRPDEFGGSQMKPSDFAKHTIQEMSQAFSFPAVRQFQNLTSSHDYSTSSHALLLNTSLSTMDLLRWWGLKDDLKEAGNELLNKICFGPEREKLADIPDLAQAIEALNAKATAPEVQAGLSPECRTFLTQANKEDSRGQLLAALAGLDPAVLHAFFEKITPEQLDTDAEGLGKLKAALLTGPPESGDTGEMIERLSDLPKRDDVIGKLRALPDAAGMQEILPQPVAETIRANRSSVNNMPTPFALKGRFVDELFGILKPSDLGLNADQAERLKAALKARITEPSEAKAMRAVIVNTLADFDAAEAGKTSEWQKIGNRYKLCPADLAQMKANVYLAIWQGLDDAIARHGRHFGYQPLDIALDHLFQNLDNEAWNKLPAKLKTDAFREDLKAVLYANATRPVLSKLLRMFAVQNAIPGNPSVYLPDLFAQGGSEFIKNIFVQNRNLIRLDKLENDPEFQRFFKQAGEIFKTRSGLSALNDGAVLPVPADDENGVLPVVRDNGKQQVITLINTGRPNPLNWDDGKVGLGERYAEIRSQSPVLTDYKADLSALQLAENTLYEDVQTGELFRIDAKGRLVDNRDPGRGMDIHVARTLVRKDSPAPRAVPEQEGPPEPAVLPVHPHPVPSIPVGQLAR